MDRQALLEQLVGNINAIHLDHPVRVAIDGIDAAGKTVLANELAVSLRFFGRQVMRASVDGFIILPIFVIKGGISRQKATITTPSITRALLTTCCARWAQDDSNGVIRRS